MAGKWISKKVGVKSGASWSAIKTDASEWSQGLKEAGDMVARLEPTKPEEPSTLSRKARRLQARGY